MNQLIFLDIGVIVGLGENVTSEQTAGIGKAIREWIEGTHKVLILPLADWEIIDRRPNWKATDLG
jgi:hypothetical protein